MPQLRSLAQPNARFAGDDGAADPLVRGAIARATGHEGYARALVALCASRLLLPVVASGDETEGPDPDRHAEMAAVTLDDGTMSYLLAFTGYDSLRAWRPDARPVPCLLDELSATVVPAGASCLLIDIAGPVPFTVDGEALESLAAGNALVELADGGFAWARPA
ncbi:SseB family protein [Tessaracoccus sp. Z1128]